MMKMLTILSTLMLISLSSICQTDYPKKAIINGDTLALVTIDQVKQINLTYNDKDRYKVKCDSLSKQIQLYDNLRVNSDSVISILKTQKENLNKQVSLSEEVMKRQNTIIENQFKIIKKEKLYKNISYGATVLLIILLIVK